MNCCTDGVRKNSCDLLPKLEAVVGRCFTYYWMSSSPCLSGLCSLIWEEESLVSLRLRVELVFDSVGLAFLSGWYYRAVDAW